MNPIMKWTGGKRQLISEIAKLIPEHKRYYEPFIGGGAVFFYLEPENAVIGDLNPDLINLYNSLRNNSELFLLLLEWLEQEECDNKRFKTIRNVYNSTEATPVMSAAIFVYLLRHCFNGLYRVSCGGSFNTPWNKDRRLLHVNRDVFLSAAKLLRNTDIRQGTYKDTLKDISTEDFVYLDPPYDPISSTASFTAYTKDTFSQEELAAYLRELDKKDIRWLLSNSTTEKIRRLYEGFYVTEVSVRRNINSVGNKRTGTEFLIRNYRQQDI